MRCIAGVSFLNSFCFYSSIFSYIKNRIAWAAVQLQVNNHLWHYAPGFRSKMWVCDPVQTAVCFVTACYEMSQAQTWDSGE